MVCTATDGPTGTKSSYCTVQKTKNTKLYQRHKRKLNISINEQTFQNRMQQIFIASSQENFLLYNKVSENDHDLKSACHFHNSS